MAEPFSFSVGSFDGGAPTPPVNHGFLRPDGWDDWSKYRTQFFLIIYDGSGVAHEIGDVKIGRVGLKPHPRATQLPAGHREPKPPKNFTELSEEFFSLGQSDDYYERLKRLGDGVRIPVLTALRDVAFNADIWAAVQDEEVVVESLTRGISYETVDGQFRRIARGGVRRTQYRFAYTPPKRLGDGKPPFKLTFEVDPDREPPSNVHVLIGRNGVGKTHLLSLMTKALVAPDKTAQQSGSFSWQDEDAQSSFANLVTVSFSAFDNTELLSEEDAKEDGLRYSYIGLREPVKTDKRASRPKSVSSLAGEFSNSLMVCQLEAKRERWHAAMNVLKNDPMFNALGLDELVASEGRKAAGAPAVRKAFEQMSSGHKIVILTLTRLVEKVEEKTLVLVDEPEAHLHPPLLSAFVRALSDLLADRNGVAIIATHSPVVLQEVPSTCAWVLNRTPSTQKIERPSIETFGENVGTLSREVFQLELSQSGFQKIIEKAVRTNPNYDSALFSFGEQLGGEARSVLRALFAVKDARTDL